MRTRLRSARDPHRHEEETMFLSGKRDATLLVVRPVDIHGTRFYDLEYAHDDASTATRVARVGVESVYGDPRPGDKISVSYLMNVVTGITRR